MEDCFVDGEVGVGGGGAIEGWVGVRVGAVDARGEEGGAFGLDVRANRQTK